MDEKQKLEFLMHNDCIHAYTTELYDNIFNVENIVSKKKVLTYEGNKYYGFYLEKGKEVYFMCQEIYDHLPFKITDDIEMDFKGDVINFINNVKTIKIPSEPMLSIRELVDITPGFNHSNPKHFLLYKIAAISAWCDRTNFRVVTDAGFGKDSVANVLSYLVGNSANIYGATFPKLEYNLLNKFIILNEMGNLKKDDKQNMQEFLLATGDYSNSYSKRSRRTADTLEQYDISDLSLVIFYNVPEYYISKGQEYFDTMFTKAVENRFIPFYFEGTLTTKFGQLVNGDEVLEYGRELYKKVIATLNYYKKNNLKEIKYDIDTETIYFSKQEERWQRSFYVILKYLSAYCNTQEEFTDLSNELYKSCRNYAKLVSDSQSVLE